MLNALDVSGLERDNSRDYNMGKPYNFGYMDTDQLNDDVIEDIQKRLELLDEFR